MMFFKKSAPTYPIYAAVAQAFQNCFKDIDIAPDSDFFDLGGDSLQAQNLCLALEEIMRCPADPELLFRNSTPRAMAEHFVKHRGAP